MDSGRLTVRRLGIPLAIVLVLCCVPGLLSANLITNGDFETIGTALDPIPGWTVLDAGPIGNSWFVENQRAHLGFYSAYCNTPYLHLYWLRSNDVFPAGIWTVNLWANTWWPGVSLWVRFGDQTQDRVLTVNSWANEFTPYTFRFITTGPAQVAFAGDSPDIDHFVIDDVDVAPDAQGQTPEPAGLLALAGGIAWFVLRRCWRCRGGC
jgi:hypothetical protein